MYEEDFMKIFSLLKRSMAVLLIMAIMAGTADWEVFAGSRQHIYAETQNVLLNNMENPKEWVISSADNVKMEGSVVGDLKTEGNGALRIKGTYNKKDGGEFATAVWNPLNGLDLSEHKTLEFDIYTEKALDGKSLNMNITNGNEIIFMGSIAAGEERSWKHISIDLSQKQRSNITEIKFWMYSGDSPENVPAEMIYVIDRIGTDPVETTEQEQIVNKRTINAMEDISDWKIDGGSSQVSLDALVTSETTTEGKGALLLKGIYTENGSDFANVIWRPENGLDWSAVQKISMDVYAVKKLEGKTININIFNNDNIVYQGSINSGQEGSWSEYMLDVSQLARDNITEIKFWMYAGDSPDTLPAEQQMVLDNFCVYEKPAVESVIASIGTGTKVTPGTTISLTTATEDAEIYYTTDATNPVTSDTRIRYQGEVLINRNMKLRAYAVKNGMLDSRVSDFVYTLGTDQEDERFYASNQFGNESFMPLFYRMGKTIDGNLDDWEQSTGIELPDNKYYSNNPDDFSADAWMSYDENNYYLALDVIDDEHEGIDGYGMYGGDCVQVAFSAYGDDYGPEFGFANVNGNPSVYTWYTGSAKEDQSVIDFKTVRDGNHTRYEIAIPWTAIFQKRPEQSFRMTILVGDSDKSTSSSTVEWKAGISSGKTAKDFATIVMIPEGKEWGSTLVTRDTRDGSVGVDYYIYNYSSIAHTYNYVITHSAGTITGTVNIPVGLCWKKSLTGKADGEVVYNAEAVDEKGSKDNVSWSNSARNEGLDEEEAQKRQQQLEKRVTDEVSLNTDTWKLMVDKSNGSWLLKDLTTDTVWSSDVTETGMGTVEYEKEGTKITTSLNHVKEINEASDKLSVTFTTHAGEESQDIVVLFEKVKNGKGIKVSYQAKMDENSDLKVSGVNLLNHALEASDTDQGELVVPEGVGKLYKADGVSQFTKTYQTYGNYNMAFAGVVKSGSGMLVSWDSPDTELLVTHERVDNEYVNGTDMVTVSLKLTKKANAFIMTPVGKASYVEIAKEYRKEVQEKGYAVPFSEKKKTYTNTELLYGAATAKPDTLIRGKDNTYNSHTFEEVGLVAEHWKNDLEIDRSLFTLGGWINKGFDNQYPDILPAAPEAGGNEGLQTLSEKIKSFGYLFGLHDNYQDMYTDAPSFDENVLMYDKNGNAMKGGVWAGGIPYLMSSVKAFTFAERNLPQVNNLFAPTSYFIDTTLNVPLYDSYDPNPLTKDEDMAAKTKLISYAKDTFGIFGSEGGVEWGIPYTDYFEGMLSGKTTGANDGSIIPLMELVYGDCVNLYTHMSEKIGSYGKNTAKSVVSHILYAENPLYQLDDGVYYQKDDFIPVSPSVKSFRQISGSSFEISYDWNVLEDVTSDCQTIFTHFVSGNKEFAEGSLAFQEGHDVPSATTSWKAGDVIEDGPYTVIVPSGKTGRFAVSIMLTKDGNRQVLNGENDSYNRYVIGYVNVFADGTMSFEDAGSVINENYNVFARNDNGWGSEKNLGPQDTQIKNSWEVLSYLNRITAETPMTDHKYLNEDGTVELSVFRDVKIVVNFGKGNFEWNGVQLPQYGFYVDSPSYIAFYANNYEGNEYPDGALFTVRSEDGKEISQSEKIRIYHGFGNSKITVNGKQYEVASEMVVTEKKDDQNNTDHNKRQDDVNRSNEKNSVDNDAQQKGESQEKVKGTESKNAESESMTKINGKAEQDSISKKNEKNLSTKNVCNAAKQDNEKNISDVVEKENEDQADQRQQDEVRQDVAEAEDDDLNENKTEDNPAKESDFGYTNHFMIVLFLLAIAVVTIYIFRKQGRIKNN